jgi:hypothetical protein
MSMQAPSYINSPYYNEKTGQLRDGAPQELIDEYNEYRNSDGCCEEVPPQEYLARPLTDEDIRDALDSDY